MELLYHMYFLKNKMNYNGTISRGPSTSICWKKKENEMKLIEEL
jgi:hypothetical protein